MLDVIVNINYTLTFCVYVLCMHMYLVVALWCAVVYTHVDGELQIPLDIYLNIRHNYTFPYYNKWKTNIDHRARHV